jgi:hypothetical protein
VVNDPPRAPRRAGPLAGLLTALLAKDPADRPNGPKVRAWLSWLLVVAPSSLPTEVLPTQRPSGAGSLAPPAFEPDEAAAGTPPAGEAPAAGPSRPLLPPAPPVRRRTGRRLLGVLALLLFGGLLTAWLIGAFQPERTRDQAAPAATRSGAGTTRTTDPAPSTTKGPATTQAPTTRTTAPRSGLPAGWRPFTNRAGSNRVGVPPGFRARTRQTYNATVVEEQAGARRVFTVRSQNPSAPLPQASRDYRAWARRNFAGFREVRYAENQTYAGHGGAVVFEYEAVRDGRRVHVSHINVKGRTWGYNVEFIVPAGQWDASRALARQFEQAFEPLG